MIAPVPGHCILVAFKPSKKGEIIIYVFGHLVSNFLLVKIISRY